MKDLKKLNKDIKTLEKQLKKPQFMTFDNERLLRKLKRNLKSKQLEIKRDTLKV
jgi:hypothetical protein